MPPRRLLHSVFFFVTASMAALVVGVSEDARADIYTYTGADGVVHYSNTPPPSRARGVRHIRTSGPAPARRGRSPRRGARDTSPERYRRYDPFITEAAALYRLPEPFLRAVIRVESDYNPEVVSHAGACGLMQLMPGTAARMGVSDIFDPRQNILGGARYLRILANTFNGDLVLTVAAYNAGEGAVVRHRGIPPTKRPSATSAACSAGTTASSRRERTAPRPRRRATEAPASLFSGHPGVSHAPRAVPLTSSRHGLAGDALRSSSALGAVRTSSPLERAFSTGWEAAPGVGTIAGV